MFLVLIEVFWLYSFSYSGIIVEKYHIRVHPLLPFLHYQMQNDILDTDVGEHQESHESETVSIYHYHGFS